MVGDPVYISGTDNLRVLGSAPNDVGDNSVGITVDIDGDIRPASGSTTVDIGADEFTPLAGDLDFISGDFIKGFCLSSNDSIVLGIYNLIGSAVDFSVDALTVTYDVTGPANTTGSIVVNTGTLNSQDTLVVYQGGIDLSVPGTYTLNAYIDGNAVNVLALNDTLDPSVDLTVHPEFEVNPKTYIMPSANDSVEICVESSFFGGGTVFISEVCHFKTTTGAPVGGWPSYLSADDYIEITGRPGADLDGITLEQWSTTAMMNSYTFPSGVVLGPNGTAIIAVGQATSSTPSPSNYYYHGDVATTFSSGGSNGRILKDANGVIIDAVGYGAYTFPAASGVTAADWSGSTGTASGTCGVRLIGPNQNSATDWVVSSAINPQDPNLVNPNVSCPTQVGLRASPGHTTGW
ncbi:MAG: lamin tail domain-containing protein [Owenweeksia sp.]|nr:lamin tail domain-containing protein [Owenweeksia sp.]